MTPGRAMVWLCTAAFFACIALLASAGVLHRAIVRNGLPLTFYDGLRDEPSTWLYGYTANEGTGIVWKYHPVYFSLDNDRGQDVVRRSSWLGGTVLYRHTRTYSSKNRPGGLANETFFWSVSYRLVYAVLLVPAVGLAAVPWTRRGLATLLRAVVRRSRRRERRGFPVEPVTPPVDDGPAPPYGRA